MLKSDQTHVSWYKASVLQQVLLRAQRHFVRACNDSRHRPSLLNDESGRSVSILEGFVIDGHRMSARLERTLSHSFGITLMSLLEPGFRSITDVPDMLVSQL